MCYACFVPNINFSYLQKLEPLQRFYQLVWKFYRVNIALVDLSGTRGLSIGPMKVTAPFCAKLQEIDKRHNCLDCDRRHFEIASRQRRPLRYRCFAGLTEFIIPIVLDGEIIAYLQSGQVQDAPITKEDWLGVSRALQALCIDDTGLHDLYAQCQVISPEDQESLISMLELFSNYVAHAQNQMLLTEQSWNSQIVDRAKTYIRNHQGSRISLDEIARAVYTSKRNLTRIFLKETGLTVLDFIHEIRLDRACGELRTSNKSITKVAFECGFGSIQQFNRVFRRGKGVPPLIWKSRQSQERARRVE